MKNIIEYFYKINISKIIFKNNLYIIVSNDIKYIFKELSSIDNIGYLKELQKYNLFHKIIYNFYGEMFTNYNDTKYILMMINIKENAMITIDDIEFVSKIVNFNSVNIREVDKLWKKKIDNFESYINSKCSDFTLREYYDYFIGLGENAICYYSYVNKNKVNYGFTYKRIYKEDTLYELYDPTNIVIAPIVRGLAEYIKMSFFSGTPVPVGDILKIQFEYDDAVLFISRLLFPTYFFDLYKNDGCENASEIKSIIAQSCSYEKYVGTIIEGLKKRQINLPQIRWIDI